MLSRLAPLLHRKLLWTIALIIMAVSWNKAIEENDAHWVNRGGALIAAFAAGAVFLQIVIEIDLEKMRVITEKKTKTLPPYDSMSVIERTANELKNKRIDKDIEELENKRLQVVLNVVVCAMVGELLHGFGDLIVCATTLKCFH